MPRALSIVTAAAAGAAGAAAAPPIPLWPAAFSVPFNESMGPYPGSGSGNTTGMWYYDVSNASHGLERVDRASGRADHWCHWMYGSEDTPCTHLVRGGARYLYWPDKGACCLCVKDIGPPRRDWLVEMNATYVGRQQLRGLTTDEWDGKLAGAHPLLSDNYVWMVAGGPHDGAIARVVQKNCNDAQDFDVARFAAGPQDASLFELPRNAGCDKRCPLKMVACDAE